MVTANYWTTNIRGSGSPENVVSAAQKSLYMDTAGTAGSILYIKKRDASVAGDKKRVGYWCNYGIF